MKPEETKMGRDMDNNYEWRKKNIKRFILELNRTNDSKVLEHLEKQPNKRQYLIGLIEEDMKRGN